jgi:hypothetical protein
MKMPLSMALLAHGSSFAVRVQRFNLRRAGDNEISALAGLDAGRARGTGRNWNAARSGGDREAGLETGPDPVPISTPVRPNRRTPLAARHSGAAVLYEMLTCYALPTDGSTVQPILDAARSSSGPSSTRESCR